MKKDFEKGTKVCSKCKRELPISEFNKNKRTSDGLSSRCRECSRKETLECYNKKPKLFRNKTAKDARYKSNLDKINKCRKARVPCDSDKYYSMLVWVDKENTNSMTRDEYSKMYHREWNRQQRMAVSGRETKRFKNEKDKLMFLFCFDLERMLKDNVYYNSNKNKKYITKWWKGEIKHWTVNDGIWKE